MCSHKSTHRIIRIHEQLPFWPLFRISTQTFISIIWFSSGFRTLKHFVNSNMCIQIICKCGEISTLAIWVLLILVLLSVAMINFMIKKYDWKCGFLRTCLVFPRNGYQPIWSFSITCLNLVLSKSLKITNHISSSSRSAFKMKIWIALASSSSTHVHFVKQIRTISKWHQK